MELYPHFSDASFDEGFSPAIDYFGLSDFGNRITNLLLNLEVGSSLVLDGKWGTGKTHFAKMLKGHLKKQSIPVIYFNAFEHDHMSVPFEAICSAITKATNENSDQSEVIRDKFLKVAGKVGKGVALAAGRIGVRLATAGALDLTDLGLVEGNADKIADIVDDKIEKSVQAAILSGAVAERTLQEFRNELSELRQELAGSSDHPLVVIIDELDRCRPDFSIGVIESIKHFFGAQRIHFLLVTNLEQMANYANHIYGTKGQSAEYLSKFYDIPIPFPPKSLQNHQTRQGVIISHYFNERMPNYFDGHVLSSAKNDLTLLANLHTISLRDTHKICASVSIALLTLNKGHGGLGYLVAPLCAMKYVKPSAYKRISMGILNTSDLDEFFDDPDEEKDFSLFRTKEIFSYHMVDDETAKSERFRNYGSTLARIMLNRRDALPHVVHTYIESFNFPELRDENAS